MQDSEHWMDQTSSETRIRVPLVYHPGKSALVEYNIKLSHCILLEDSGILTKESGCMGWIIITAGRD
jgi:hypothetical protein